MSYRRVVIVPATGLLLLAMAGSWASGAQAAAACDFSAWSTDTDPDGLNIRAQPGTDSAVIGTIPPPRELEGDAFASEVSVTGSRDGWFRIDSAHFIDHYETGVDRIFFEGDGWVSGRYLGLEIEGRHLYGSPSPDAPVVFDFVGSSETSGPHDFALERLHACQGRWVEVEGTVAGQRVRGWTDDTCSSQVTTCP